MNLRRRAFLVRSGHRGAVPQQTDVEILSRSPTVYLPMTDGTVSDESGNGVSASISGTAAGTVAMGLGAGIDLGGSAHVVVPHSSLFNTATATNHAYVFSEPGFAIRLIVNEALADWKGLVVKGAGDYTNFDFALYVMADGRIRLRAWSPWVRIDHDSPPGAIVQGQEHIIGWALGRDGLRLWVNGKECNGGRPNGRHYYGLEHRTLDNSGTTAATVVTRNTADIRIGTDHAGVRTDLTVNHFAAFFRATYAGQMTSSDMQEIGRGSGTIEHPLWGLQTLTATSPSQIQGHINTLTATGGTVELTGGGTLSANLELKSNVLLKLTASMSIASGFSLRNPVPTVTNRTLNADASSGSRTVTLSSVSGLATGHVLAIIKNDIFDTAYGEPGGTAENTSYKSADMGVVDDITGNVVTLDRPLLFDYVVGGTALCASWAPTGVDCGIVGPGTISLLQTNGDAYSAANQPFVPQAFVRMMIDAEIRATASGQYAVIGCKPKGGIDLLVGPNAYLGTEAADAKYGQDGHSPLSPSSSNHHPYGFQVSQCRDMVANRARFRSKGWHAVDCTGDNVQNDWGGASAVGVDQRSQFVACTTDSPHEPDAFACHQSTHTRVFAHEQLSGGGFTNAGYQKEMNGFLSRDDGVERLGYSIEFYHGGLKRSAILNIDLNCTGQTGLFQKRTWFNVQGTTHGVSRNLFANIQRASGLSPNEGPDGTYALNTYDNVESPLPSA